MNRHAVLMADSAADVRDRPVHFDRIEHIEPLDRNAPFRLAINSVVIDDIRLSTVSTTGHRIKVVDDSITILMPWHGIIETDHAGDRVAVQSGSLLIPSTGPRSTQCGIGYSGLVLQLPLARLNRLAASNPGDDWRPGRQAPGMIDATRGEAGAFARYARYLALELHDSDWLLHSTKASQAAAVLLGELLGDLWRAESTRNVQPITSGSLRQVARAEEMMRERAGDALSIADVACKLGISTRALQLAFQQHRELGPRQALEAIRLDTAHTKLLSAAPDENVTKIALDCGITHLGRFSARYRERFGETPRATLRRRQPRN